MPTNVGSNASVFLNKIGAYRNELATKVGRLESNKEQLHRAMDEATALQGFEHLNLEDLTSRRPQQVYERPVLYASFGGQRVGNLLPDDEPLEIKTETRDKITLRNTKTEAEVRIYRTSSSYFRGWGDFFFQDPVTRHVREMAQSYFSGFAKVEVKGTFRPKVVIQPERRGTWRDLNPFRVYRAGELKREIQSVQNRQANLEYIRGALKSEAEALRILLELDVNALVEGKSTSLYPNHNVKAAVKTRLEKDFHSIAKVEDTGEAITIEPLI